MNSIERVAVCSRSFSNNSILRKELLSRYENVTFNDDGLKLSGDTLIEFLRGHDKAITALEKMDGETLSQLPDLQVISKYGVGLDMIDMNAMRTYKKHLGWTGGVNRRSVSELVISFAIAMLRHVPAAHREVLNGTWRQHVGGYLTGRTVGIVGCGYIGKDLIPLLQAFDCTILINDIVDMQDSLSDKNVKQVSLDVLLSKSDIVTLHVPLDDSTHGMLNADKLALLKADSILINVARGELVDEEALKHLLKEKRIAAAAFDVFAIEPPLDIELLELPNFLVTPHIGGSAHEAILAMGLAAIDGLENHQIPGIEFE